MKRIKIILIGVLADQQLVKLRQARADRAKDATLAAPLLSRS